MREARTTVATVIADGFAGDPPELVPVVVTSSVAPTDPPQRRTVIVSPSRIAPADVACPVRTYTVTVYVLSPMTAGPAADDDVDDLVDDVIDALDGVALEWSDVRRGTFLDAYPSYTLTVEVHP